MSRLFLLAFLAISGCSDMQRCDSKILQVAREPGTDHYAVTASRNCGATTDYATVIRVGRARKPQSEAQEIFLADSNHGVATPGGGGTVWTSVVWSGPGQLSIAYASKARVFKERDQAEGASTSYRKAEPPAPGRVD